MRMPVALVLWSACLVGATLVYGEATSTAVVCTEVKDRAPVGAGDRFPAGIGRLACFSEVKGGSGMVAHVWFHGDAEQARMELPVRAERWRTWSEKRIDPRLTGAWRVEVRDGNGTVLATAAFTVE